ncbi:MAG: TlpA family protein disulfide reductase [Candidatus Eremiobacteraeota bacterium]|nr:TlpA family protein disulfide reductase [Candidatus Eremiobacteraeota bacterium]
MKKFTVIFTALVLAACSSGTHTNTQTGSAPARAKVGAQAPAFDEATVEGTTLSMAQLRGKPVYLNFFATWCPPCNEEAPDVSAVQQQFKGDGLQVVGVDILEDKSKAQKFVDQHRLSYPAVVDSGTLRDAYNINGMPVHVFIDRTGVVRKIEIGELSKAEMIADVKAIL